MSLAINFRQIFKFTSQKSLNWALIVKHFTYLLAFVKSVIFLNLASGNSILLLQSKLTSNVDVTLPSCYTHLLHGEDTGFEVGALAV